jgi:hypothetical protein
VEQATQRKLLHLLAVQLTPHHLLAVLPTLHHLHAVQLAVQLTLRKSKFTFPAKKSVRYINVSDR